MLEWTNPNHSNETRDDANDQCPNTTRLRNKSRRLNNDPIFFEADALLAKTFLSWMICLRGQETPTRIQPPIALRQFGYRLLIFHVQGLLSRRALTPNVAKQKRHTSIATLAKLASRVENRARRFEERHEAHEADFASSSVVPLFS